MNSDFFTALRPQKDIIIGTHVTKIGSTHRSQPHVEHDENKKEPAHGYSKATAHLGVQVIDHAVVHGEHHHEHERMVIKRDIGRYGNQLTHASVH